jgi:predicted nucleotidyltransferase
MKPPFPTPYPDVNEIVNFLLGDVKEILGDRFIGMYLHGSLANVGFDAHSDIDVIVVSEDAISEQKFEALKRLHERIAVIDSPWWNQLEVSYIPMNALRRFDPSNNKHPHLDRGTGEELKMETHGSDWVIQRHILRERGIVVTGPDPKTLVDPVSPNDLRKAVIDGMPLWLNPILENPAQINTRGYQSFFVLSLCRMLYTLKHGGILSKKDAADWAKSNLDPHWTPLIDRALIGRQNSNEAPDPEDLRSTLDMIRYGLEQIKPTMYPDVNEVLSLLLSNVKDILRERFVGMYLYGSLSGGDYDLETSDIDFLVVTGDFLPKETIDDLEEMHKQLWAAGNAQANKLEGAYVPKGLIRRHDPNGAFCPTVNEGKFYVAPLGSDWVIQRHVVREYGVVIDGPNPKTMIEPVMPDDIRTAVLGTLREWWLPMLDDPQWLHKHNGRYRAFAVITMCRVLHALEYGTIVSKPRALQWAQTKLDKSWKLLIDTAAAVSYHEQHEISVRETLDFIRFTSEQASRFNEAQNSS